jgi:hypothetical protein
MPLRFVSDAAISLPPRHAAIIDAIDYFIIILLLPMLLMLSLRYAMISLFSPLRHY